MSSDRDLFDWHDEYDECESKFEFFRIRYDREHDDNPEVAVPPAKKPITGASFWD